MAKNEISDYDETNANNTDISGIAVSNSSLIAQIDDIVRAQMGALKRWFRSDLFRLRDSTDQTKLLAFGLSGLTTATTRTLTVPDYNGSVQALALGTAIPSAATTNIGSASGSTVHITGTTTITALGTVAAGIEKRVIFDGVLTLTHNATSLILPRATNITTGAGDAATFVSEGSGNWRCAAYQVAAPTTTASNINSGTAQASTSGVAIAFTGVIPSWAKRISIIFSGVSTNGTDAVGIQLGTGGVYTTTGYLSGTGDVVGAAAVNSTAFIPTQTAGNASHVRHGIVTFDLITGNTWVASGAMGLSSTGQASVISGSISIAGVVDSIRATTTPASNAFDAGTINIFWE